MNKIKLVEEFIQKYHPFKYENDERLYNNISSFVKISSGIISLKESVKSSPNKKHIMGERMHYLERLSTLPYF